MFISRLVKQSQNFVYYTLRFLTACSVQLSNGTTIQRPANSTLVVTKNTSLKIITPQITTGNRLSMYINKSLNTQDSPWEKTILNTNIFNIDKISSDHTIQYSQETSDEFTIIAKGYSNLKKVSSYDIGNSINNTDLSFICIEQQMPNGEYCCINKHPNYNNYFYTVTSASKNANLRAYLKSTTYTDAHIYTMNTDLRSLTSSNFLNTFNSEKVLRLQSSTPDNCLTFTYSSYTKDTNYDSITFVAQLRRMKLIMNEYNEGVLHVYQISGGNIVKEFAINELIPTNIDIAIQYTPYTYDTGKDPIHNRYHIFNKSLVTVDETCLTGNQTVRATSTRAQTQTYNTITITSEFNEIRPILERLSSSESNPSALINTKVTSFPTTINIDGFTPGDLDSYELYYLQTVRYDGGLNGYTWADHSGFNEVTGTVTYGNTVYTNSAAPLKHTYQKTSSVVMDIRATLTVSRNQTSSSHPMYCKSIQYLAILKEQTY